MDPLDQQIEAIARRQGWHITTDQLYALGLTRAAVRHRVARGFLIAAFKGVYAVGHLPTHPVDKAAGALLAAGPKAAMAGAWASTLWQIEAKWPEQLEVITPVDRRPRGVIVHRAPWLASSDIRIRQGLRVTSPQLTVLHNARRLTDRKLTRAINELRFARHMNERHLLDVVYRFPRHPGARLILAKITHKNPTRSELEEDFQRFIATGDFPFHHINHSITTYTVDIFFPREQLIVETDGWDAHGTFEAFKRDRRQDSDILAATGIPTVRLTHAEVTKEAPATRRKLDRILQNRRSGS